MRHVCMSLAILAVAGCGAKNTDPPKYHQLAVVCNGKVEAQATSAKVQVVGDVAYVQYKGELVGVGKPADCWFAILPTKATSDNLNLGFLPKPAK